MSRIDDYLIDEFTQRRHFSSFPVSSRNQSRTAPLLRKRRGMKRLGKRGENFLGNKPWLFDLYLDCSRPGRQLLLENLAAFFSFRYSLYILYPLLIYVPQLEMYNVTVCKYFSKEPAK